jgi:hypothetical protein
MLTPPALPSGRLGTQNDSLISGQALSDAVQVFVNRHPEYTTRSSGSALLIRPRERTVCDAALQRPLAGSVMTAPAYEMFWRLARSVNPSRVPAAPPTVVCGGNCGPAFDRNHLVNVTMSFGGERLEGALSQLVAQAPGLVWVLRESWLDQRSEWACDLMYFDGASQIGTSYVLASAPIR